MNPQYFRAFPYVVVVRVAVVSPEKHTPHKKHFALGIILGLSVRSALRK